MSVLNMMFDGAFASAAATVLSNPFDVMLTRMQLQGELKKKGDYQVIYKNLFQGMYRVAVDEGVLALQQGFISAICWQVTQNGIRIGLYDPVKMELESLFGGASFGISVLSGAMCGVVGALVASPFVLVKIRLQSQNSHAVEAHLNRATTGEQHNYKGVTDAFIKIYRKDGICGLWQGGMVACQRTMVGSAVQLATYEHAKNGACKWTEWGAKDVRVHVIASIVASICITVFMTPFNVVMTRSYNNKKGDKAKYSSIIPIAIWQVYRVEGITGLYKGSLSLFSRMAPHTICTFVFLEHIRKMREAYTNRFFTAASAPKSNTGSNHS